MTPARALPRCSGGQALANAAPGTQLRIRIAAQDVMLARDRPSGLSALNILPATVASLHFGEGPGAMVELHPGQNLLLARITRRSALALNLPPRPARFCRSEIRLRRTR